MTDTTTADNEPRQAVGAPVERPVRLAPKRAARLRWKKHSQPTGLQAVGAGPQGSTLHDGATEYASVMPLGGGWRGRLRGWYWSCGSEVGGEVRNTCNEPAPDEATAKAQAMEFVKAALAQKA